MPLLFLGLTPACISPSAVVVDGGGAASGTGGGGNAGAAGSHAGGAGSAGAAGQAGGAGQSGGASGAPAADGGVDCASLPLCDDFEADTPSAPPDPSLWSVVMGCNPNATNGPVDGGGLQVSIDGTRAHSGKNSMRVVGGDSCGVYFVNTSAFAKLGQQVYARFWAHFSGPPTPNHNGFLSMANGGSNQLRLGFQGNVIVWNALPSDSTLPDIDTQGEAQSTATTAAPWDCFEFHVDQTNGHLEFWFNNSPNPIAGLTFDGTSTQGVSDNWATGGPSTAALTNFGLGWLQLNNDYTAWFDDVALSTSRIGCD